MRIRHAVAGTAVGALLTLGAMTAPTQAAPAIPTARPPAAADGVHVNLSAASWHDSGRRYPSREICDGWADYYTFEVGTPGQCRGPYSGGIFQLWLWY
ncbi:hypothetical protein H114_03426 [Streptomyces gancidicus BKS 13-15]|uniref:Secreted protein n=1 Tax=Streptomyces gancidicus BKS 13-15 TaxID=1284664 RepID=M3C2G0_STREZ|nr:hypothetical protein H114_03426 [Streptomyces gancidicus BKS 13-15]